MSEGMIQRSPHFTNVLRGKTPMFEDWTEDPTDAANMTDGDLSTAMTTGYKTLSAGYEYAKCIYEVPAGLYLVGAIGYVVCADDVGHVRFWADSYCVENFVLGEGWKVAWAMFAAVESTIAISFTANAPATVSPNIKEFYAVRLGDL